MTKNDIVVQIARQTDLSYKDVRSVVQKTLDSITETLAAEGKIELRKARNPRTGEPVQVAAYKTVVFKPGLLMQEKLR